MKKRYIAILDFGSQYMHLISRRIRQLGVSAKIYPTDVNARELKDAWGVIISGGPQSVVEQQLAYDPAIFELNKPILGLCYGHQLLAYHLGGIVTPAHNREYGLATLKVMKKSRLFQKYPVQSQVWMSHYDSVTRPPVGFITIGTTSQCPVAAMADEKRRFYGLQFHPEVHHTKCGFTILRNFAFNICRAQKNWRTSEYLKEIENDLKKTVGNKKVFFLVSGGVDSTVAFALTEKILGPQRVVGLHIDTGFMRAGESEEVAQELKRAGFKNLHTVDASEEFLSSIKKVRDPEKKRRRIGAIFLKTQRKAFKQLGFNDADWLLGQGTIYPDTIESGGTQAADVIKTHHNRIDEIREMIRQGKIVEPLAGLYKDEVREIGRKLGLTPQILERWPFPGPGLAIRCLGATGKEKVAKQKEINEVLKEIIFTSLADHPLGKKIKASVLPVRSVGVQGDQRSYHHPVLLYGLSCKEAVKYWKLLGDLSTTITNNVSGINRVVVDVGGSCLKNGKIKILPAFVTLKRLIILRTADAIVSNEIRRANLAGAIWQFPVILLPLSFGRGETIVLRPIESQEAMTVNFYQMPVLVLQKIVQRLMTNKGIGAVLYDITNKPPATIEWE